MVGTLQAVGGDHYLEKETGDSDDGKTHSDLHRKNIIRHPRWVSDLLLRIDEVQRNG